MESWFITDSLLNKYYRFLLKEVFELIEIELGTIEYYNSKTNEFIYEEGGTVRFEYSLKAIYEWEGKWKKPFLKGLRGGADPNEMLDFFRMMAVDELDDRFLTEEVVKKLGEYIQDSGTATTFTNHEPGQNGNNSNINKIYTSEEIYAIMFTNGIDLDFENRNLNRLLAIMRIIGNNNQPPKKMNKNDVLRQNASLNAQRKARLKTKG